MKRGLVVALVIGVLLVLVYFALFLHQRHEARKVGGKSPGVAFPFYRSELPPPEDMFDALRADTPRVRRLPEKQGVRRLLRTSTDFYRRDSIADHFTEDLRVSAKKSAARPHNNCGNDP